MAAPRPPTVGSLPSRLPHSSALGTQEQAAATGLGGGEPGEVGSVGEVTAAAVGLVAVAREAARVGGGGWRRFATTGGGCPTGCKGRRGGRVARLGREVVWGADKGLCEVRGGVELPSDACGTRVAPCWSGRRGRTHGTCEGGRILQVYGTSTNVRRYVAQCALWNGWVVGLEGRSTLSLYSERALYLAPAPSRAQT